MKTKSILTLTLLLAVVLAGCAGPAGPVEPAGPVATGQPTMTPALLPAPTETVASTEPLPAASEPPAGAPMPISSEEVVKALSDKLAIDPDQITVVSIEPVNWPNSCLGINTKEMMCLDVITPGYRIVVDVDGQQTTVHTNADLSVAYVADAEEPAGAAPDDTVVGWQSPTEPCTEGKISAQWVRFGPCGSQLGQTAPLPAQRAAELAYFAALFTSYNGQTAAGAVSLVGSGPARAEVADSRALAEWAAAVVSEAASGQAKPRVGLAMTWRRAGGIAGFCDELAVYSGGQAPATSCKTSPPSDLAARWLSSPQLDQLFGWLDSLAAFQYGQKDPAVADAMSVDLSFNGAGTTAASDADQQAMLAYAGNLFTFGALATDTRYVQADVDLPMVTGPGSQFPPIGEVSSGQAAFVTGVSQDGRWWRVLCPDDTVGDCWLAGDRVTPQVVAPAASAPISYDPPDIYATVIRQVYTVDHTFGRPPNFPVIYLVRRTDDSVGASGSSANSQTLAPADQARISALLADLPAQFIWVDAAADAPRAANGAVADRGAIITVGAITPQDDGTLQVPASIYIANLAAGGQTYVLANTEGGWQITGNTGSRWVS